MFPALRVTFALIRIPKLFISLFLFPILVSLAIVFFQVLVVGLFLDRAVPSYQEKIDRLQQKSQSNPLRKLVFGSYEPLAPYKICRWSETRSSQGEIVEAPPAGTDCQPDRLDIAILTNSPQTLDVAPFALYLNGNTERLHICKNCHPDVVIDARNTIPELHAYSFTGALLVSLLHQSQTVEQNQYKIINAVHELRKTLGLAYLHFPGYQNVIGVSKIPEQFGFICNVVTILMISLWLAIKAHRNILDYFARNGALLPLVSAISSKVFYKSIWLLTLLRVLIFLAASIPMTVFILTDENTKIDFLQFFSFESLSVLNWILALCSGLTLAAIIASIAELQQRHYYFSFAYKYLPLLAALFGAVIWFATIPFAYDVMLLIRNFVICLPVIGLTPVLLSPLLKPPIITLAIHCILSCLLTVYILRYNQKWLALHVEQI